MSIVYNVVVKRYDVVYCTPITINTCVKINIIFNFTKMNNFLENFKHV